MLCGKVYESGTYDVDMEKRCFYQADGAEMACTDIGTTDTSSRPPESIPPDIVISGPLDSELPEDSIGFSPKSRCNSLPCSNVSGKSNSRNSRRMRRLSALLAGDSIDSLKIDPQIDVQKSLEPDLYQTHINEYSTNEDLNSPCISDGSSSVFNVNEGVGVRSTDSCLIKDGNVLKENFISTPLKVCSSPDIESQEWSENYSGDCTGTFKKGDLAENERILPDLRDSSVHGNHRGEQREYERDQTRPKNQKIDHNEDQGDSDCQELEKERTPEGDQEKMEHQQQKEALPPHQQDQNQELVLQNEHHQLKEDLHQQKQEKADDGMVTVIADENQMEDSSINQLNDTLTSDGDYTKLNTVKSHAETIASSEVKNPSITEVMQDAVDVEIDDEIAKAKVEDASHSIQGELKHVDIPNNLCAQISQRDRNEQDDTNPISIDTRENVVEIQGNEKTTGVVGDNSSACYQNIQLSSVDRNGCEVTNNTPEMKPDTKGMSCKLDVRNEMDMEDSLDTFHAECHSVINSEDSICFGNGVANDYSMGGEKREKQASVKVEVERCKQGVIAENCISKPADKELDSTFTVGKIIDEGFSLKENKRTKCKVSETTVSGFASKETIPDTVFSKKDVCLPSNSNKNMGWYVDIDWNSETSRKDEKDTDRAAFDPSYEDVDSCIRRSRSTREKKEQKIHDLFNKVKLLLKNVDEDIDCSEDVGNCRDLSECGCDEYSDEPTIVFVDNDDIDLRRNDYDVQEAADISRVNDNNDIMSGYIDSSSKVNEVKEERTHTESSLKEVTQVHSNDEELDEDGGDEDMTGTLLDRFKLLFCSVEENTT